MTMVELSKEDLYDLELLRALKRSSQGLSISEQDIMTFLVNAKDDRERTRLNEKTCHDHSGWELVTDTYPITFGWLKQQAQVENIYYISLDGLQRQEAILMTKAKNIPSQTPLTIENIQGQPPPTEQQQQEQPKGRSLLHPLRKG